ncbi:MAG: hypothetical protein DHS20C09_15890 [marine bacterium B5-7]|nr:MAG: hypothetical protein DHS20C09_15890 [marine bacterium B5-7]
MNSKSKRRHVFISHHHKDDAQLDKFTAMFKSKGIDFRNSSIRAKPSNQERLDKKQVKDETIKRLLRMKISWATSTVVLIGKDTHKRPWVSWEIEQAHKQGKPIVGVYARGGTEADAPKELEDYATSIVSWNSKSILSAIDGASVFQSPDGSVRPPSHSATNINC